MSSEADDSGESSAPGACSSSSKGTFHAGAVRLNRLDCLSLSQIVQSFGDNPISEEQAWGIVYQSCLCLKKLFAESHKAIRLFLVLDFEQLFIHQDGYIHESSFTSEGGKNRIVAVSEQKILEKMAILVFTALERGLQDEYQRQLSPELENLLDLMLEDFDHEDARRGTNEVDEGIVMQDLEDEPLSYQPVILNDILRRCESHLASGSEASQHFRNVCRALVTQALELSTFLRKTKETQLCTEELQNLAFSDWANLWQEMMSDLRNGVKLKKTEYTKTPIEFALTPYEMLMEDIRSRRYKLNKVMTDEKLPSRLKKDAHSLLLDFIRSRPPLKPANERKLPPRENHSTPQELLMASIRSGEGRLKLRKTSGPPEPKNIQTDYPYIEIEITREISKEMNHLGTRTIVATQLDATPRNFQRDMISEVVQRRRGSLALSGGMVCRSKSVYIKRPVSASIILSATSGTKRVIYPDSNYSNFDPDDDSDDDKDSDQEMRTKTPPPYQPPVRKKADFKKLNHSQEDIFDGLFVSTSIQNEQPSVLSVRNLTNLIYETYSMAPELLSVDSQRSISTLNLASLHREPFKKDFLQTFSDSPRRSFSTFNLFSTNPCPSKSLSQRNTSSRKLSLSPQPLSVDGILSTFGMKKTLEPVENCEIGFLNHCASPKTSVSSPPSEFVHIRSTLNRAKFEESQSLDDYLREEILKAKVCFGCKKTRFYFFNRSYKCPWCNYTFCSNCVSKVSVREDFVDLAPLHALTPNRKQDVQLRTAQDTNGKSENKELEYVTETTKNNRAQEGLRKDAYLTKSRTFLRRSNTLGRIDHYGRSDGKECIPDPAHNRFQPEDCLTAKFTKKVQLVLCSDCAEVADKIVPEENRQEDLYKRLKIKSLGTKESKRSEHEFRTFD